MKHTCTYCRKETDHIALSHHKGYGVVQCLVCKLISLDPKPTDLKALYGDQYYLKTGYENYEKRFFQYRDIFESLFAQRLKMIRRYKKSGRVLDIGCAHGFLLEYLKKAGYECFGTDISEYAVEYAKKHFNIPIQLGDIDAINYPENYFDVIVMLDVIEHVRDPLATFERVKKYLKDDGILIVQTPFDLYHWEVAAKAFFSGKKIGTNEPSAIPMHLYFFTPKTFKMLARKAGYHIVHFETGTYGKVRLKIDPPSVRNPLAFIYHKMGVRTVLQKTAEFFKVSDGLNLVLKKDSNGKN